MSRLLLCAALAVSLSALAPAEDTKAAKKETIKGKIRKVDPSAHLIVVGYEVNKVPKQRQLKLLTDTKFTFHTSAGKKEVKGRKEAYKVKALKENASVTAVTDGKDRALEVEVGKASKGS
jgi:hypothetical protein